MFSFYKEENRTSERVNDLARVTQLISINMRLNSKFWDPPLVFAFLNAMGLGEEVEKLGGKKEMKENSVVLGGVLENVYKLAEGKG